MVVLAGNAPKNGVKEESDTSDTSSSPSSSTSLWPNGVAIEVIGLTGDFASGKTIFGLSIAPGPSTLVYDCEKSSGTYKSLGFDRVDVSDEMVKRHPNGYKPVDLFLWWLDHIKSIKPGQYRVIMLDPVSEIESGIVEYVRQNPEKFGFTAKQFTLAAGLMWGAVKDFWKSILADLAARCETFVFTSHLRNVWKGNAPTGKKAPKGKETLMELASLYLHMDRRADAKGNVPDVPGANVLKSRLADHRWIDGELVWVDLLPPRLPHATPKAIREYILNPPDYAKLKAGERLIEEKETEADIAAMRLAAAEAERDAEALRNERLNRAAQQAEQSGQAAKAGVSVAGAASGATSPSVPASSPVSARTPNVAGKVMITDAQLEGLRNLKADCHIDLENWKKILAKRNALSARDLTEEQAAEMIEALTKLRMKVIHQEELKKAENDLPKK